MNETILSNHNEKVCKNDIVIHGGDFHFSHNRKVIQEFIKKLNGTHIFLKGSHDYWLPPMKSIQIWEKNISGHYIVVCHYQMRSWARSHYGSWQLFGHSHGLSMPVGKQHDIGVDNNNYYPVSFDEIVEIMKNRDENPNLIYKRPF